MTPRQTPLDKRAHRQIFSRNETFDLSLHLKKSDSILDREDVRFDELWVTWPLWPVGGRGQKWYVVGRTCHAVGWQRSNVDSIVAVTSFISLERERCSQVYVSCLYTCCNTVAVRACSVRPPSLRGLSSCYCTPCTVNSRHRITAPFKCECVLAPPTNQCASQPTPGTGLRASKPTPHTHWGRLINSNRLEN